MKHRRPKGFLSPEESQDFLSFLERLRGHTMDGKFEVDGLVLVDQGDMHWVGRILEIFKDSLLLTENIDPNDDYDGGAEFQKSLCTPIKIISLEERWRLENCDNCGWNIDGRYPYDCYAWQEGIQWQKDNGEVYTCSRWKPCLN